jgi:predicted small metal-binding protein
MKALKCRDVGMNCDFEAKGETEQEVLAKAAAHAKADHGLTEVPAEILAKVKAAIHDA